MELWPIVNGLATYVPGNQYLRTKKGGGGTAEALYCYNVWLKHLTLVSAHGLKAIPSRLGELGPGGSLGVGLAAMLSGVDHYFALDVVKSVDPERNLKILGELVTLFKARHPKEVSGWPDVGQYLDDSQFPAHILTDELLEQSLSQERIDKIYAALSSSGTQENALSINYVAPWVSVDVIKSESLDLIISHSVLEHVTDMDTSYRAMASWIKPGGFVSHQVDLSGHGINKKWNGYRQYSDWQWKIIMGTRPYLINREPYSAHMELFRKYGFNERCNLKNYANDGIERAHVASRWRDISDEDLNCRGFYFAGQKAP